MTQENEMPNSVFLSPGLGGIVGFEQFPTSTEYIRRAVTKEEAGYILEDMPEKGSAEMEHHFAIRLKGWYAKNKTTIRKMAEAHK